MSGRRRRCARIESNVVVVATGLFRDGRYRSQAVPTGDLTRVRRCLHPLAGIYLNAGYAIIALHLGWVSGLRWKDRSAQ